ncbi:MAG: hypothetical protein AAGM67_17745, partial [Bacteroidota bacterium]
FFMDKMILKEKPQSVKRLGPLRTAERCCQILHEGETHRIKGGGGGLQGDPPPNQWPWQI